MIFAKAPAAEVFTALFLEVNRGRIKEHQVQFGEQIPIVKKQHFLDQIFITSQTKIVCLVLIRQSFPQKGHGPIQMMQIQLLCARYQIVPSPFITETVRAGYHQPMQYGQKDSTFHVKLELSTGQQLLDAGLNPAFFPQPLKHQCGGRWSP